MKQRIINYLLKHLLNSVSPDDIITVNKGVLYLGSDKIEGNELTSLVAEAKALEGFKIWKIMNETVRADAMEKGFNKSVKFEDIVNCKMMLYNLDIFNSIIEVIRSKE